MVNQDALAQSTTFTLTNIAAQHSQFNQRAWNQLECMVRNYMESEIPNQDAWIFTGTLGKKMTMNEDNPEKNDVRLPEYFWKAFCYVGSGTSYAFAYIQVNENDQTQSSGDNVMTMSSFSDIFFDGEPIFDDECQNASLGPWFAIKEDWNTYKSQFNCN